MARVSRSTWNKRIRIGFYMTRTEGATKFIDNRDRWVLHLGDSHRLIYSRVSRQASRSYASLRACFSVDIPFDTRAHSRRYV